MKEVPKKQAMPAVSSFKSSRVVFFTDIVGSTSIQAETADDTFLELIRDHNRIFDDTIKAFEQRVQRKKHTGDGFLGTADDAATAVIFLLRFQQNLEEEWDGVQICAGIHDGRVMEEPDGDIFGLPVSVASRVLSLASDGQILLTEPSFSEAKRNVQSLAEDHGFEWEMRCEKFKGRYLFKGVESEFEVGQIGLADGAVPFNQPSGGVKARLIGNFWKSPAAFRAKYFAVLALFIGLLLAAMVFFIGHEQKKLTVLENGLQSSLKYFDFSQRLWSKILTDLGREESLFLLNQNPLRLAQEIEPRNESETAFFLRVATDQEKHSFQDERSVEKTQINELIYKLASRLLDYPGAAVRHYELLQSAECILDNFYSWEFGSKFEDSAKVVLLGLRTQILVQLELNDSPVPNNTIPDADYWKKSISSIVDMASNLLLRVNNPELKNEFANLVQMIGAKNIEKWNGLSYASGSYETYPQDQPSGSFNEKIGFYTNKLAAIEQDLSIKPDSIELQDQSSEILLSLAKIFKTESEYNKSSNVLLKRSLLLRSILAKSPSNLQRKRDFCESLIFLAFSQYMAGRPLEALQTLQEFTDSQDPLDAYLVAQRNAILGLLLYGESGSDFKKADLLLFQARDFFQKTHKSKIDSKKAPHASSFCDLETLVLFGENARAKVVN